MASRILNSRPVASITQPILEALAFLAALAQLVEHRIRNAGVACSSHASGTNFFQETFCFQGDEPERRISIHPDNHPEATGCVPFLLTVAFDDPLEL